MFKLVASSKLEEDKEFGIKGFILNVELIKSRSAASGNAKCQLVFDQANGFNNVLSNYLLLKENKKIGGAGRGFFLETLPDVKFSQKTIMEKYNSNSDFKVAFDALTQECLLSFIPESSTDLQSGGLNTELILDESTGLYTDGIDSYEYNPDTDEYTKVD